MTKNFKFIKPASVISDEITYGRFGETRYSFRSKLVNLVLDVINSCKETDITGVCAQMSFIILGAIIPTMLIIILLCNQFIPSFDNTFMSFIQSMLPSAGFEFIKEELDQLLSYLNYIRPVIIVLSLFFGTLSTHTIISGLNQTYGYKAYSSETKLWFKSFILLILVTIIIIILFLVFRTTRSVATEVVQNTPVREYTNSVNLTLHALGTTIGIFLGILFLYTFVPEHRIKVSESYPGAIFSTLGVIIVYQAYIYFLNLSRNYLVVYGSLAGLFLLLVALYFLNLLVNLGVKLNVFISFLKRDIEENKRIL